MKKRSGYVCLRSLSVLNLILLSFNLPLYAQWNQAGLDGYYIRTITVSGSNIYAGTSGDGMFRSTNSGVSWLAANTGLIGLEFPAFAISGTNLYAGSEGEGVFLSVNNGASWNALAPLTNQFVFALALSGTDLYAGVDGGGVFRSTNNGTSWTNSTSGMTNTRVSSLVVSGTNLFAGTFGGAGVYLSTNNGTSWVAAGNGLTNTEVQTLNITSSLPGYIFAGTANGAFYTTNNGANWSSISNGLTDTYVHTFAFSGTTIFAGTDMEGVFRSTNLGASWTAMNQGLINTTVWVLTAEGSNLYAGTNGSGIFKRPLSEMVALEQVSSEMPKQFILSQNFPNPFNPSTIIQFGIIRSGNVNISVYDISGRKVETLVNGSHNTGLYEVQWDAAKYSSGVYFYTITTSEFIDTKKMLLVK